MSNRPNSIGSYSLDGREKIALSLVVPAFNEEQGIEALVQAAVTELDRTGEVYEIVVVNDGSTDHTLAILDRLSREISVVKVIRLRVNSGQHIASFIGLREAKGELVLVADADLAKALPALSDLLQTARSHPYCDIVTAVRRSRSRSIYRSLGSQLVGALVNRMTGSKLRDPASPLRLYRRRVVDAIIDADVLAQNLPILTSLLGFSVKEVEVDLLDSGRQSRYGIFSLVHLLLLALLNFSAGTRTILTLMALGAGSTLIGFLGLAGLTIHGVVTQTPIRTNLLLLSVFLVVVGLQFTLMGGIAYKIERIHANLRFRRLTADSNHDR